MNPRENSSSVDGGPFQFSLTTLLVIVAGVAVIAAGGSFGMTGMALGILVAGVGWTAIARRGGAYRVAYYTLAGTGGGVPSFFFASAWPPEPLTFERVIFATIPCLTVLLVARVLRNLILAPDENVPWRAAILAPYLVAWGTCFMLFSGFALRHTSNGNPPIAVETLILSFVPLAAIITIGMPIVGPISMFCCLWLRAVAMPHEDATRLVEPEETTEDRPDEAVL